MWMRASSLPETLTSPERSLISPELLPMILSKWTRPAASGAPMLISLCFWKASLTALLYRWTLSKAAKAEKSCWLYTLSNANSCLLSSGTGIRLLRYLMLLSAFTGNCVLTGSWTFFLSFWEITEVNFQILLLWRPMRNSITVHGYSIATRLHLTRKALRKITMNSSGGFFPKEQVLTDSPRRT
jgi:hypothetical protein